MEFFSLALSVFVVVSALWVYVDASKHKIGRTGSGGFFDIGAGAWGAVVLLLWIVGFPAYLIKRNKLIEKAKQQPVEPTARGFKIAIFVVITLLVAYSSFATVMQAAQLPNCDDTEVAETLKKAITNSPAYKLLGVSDIEIKDVSERPSSTEDKKICRGSLVLGKDLGQQVIYFSIDWQNKDKGEFWVQTIPNE